MYYILYLDYSKNTYLIKVSKYYNEHETQLSREIISIYILTNNELIEYEEYKRILFKKQNFNKTNFLTRFKRAVQVLLDK